MSPCNQLGNSCLRGCGGHLQAEAKELEQGENKMRSSGLLRKGCDGRRWEAGRPGVAGSLGVALPIPLAQASCSVFSTSVRLAPLQLRPEPLSPSAEVALSGSCCRQRTNAFQESFRIIQDRKTPHQPKQQRVLGPALCLLSGPAPRRGSWLVGPLPFSWTVGHVA